MSVTVNEVLFNVVKLSQAWLILLLCMCAPLSGYIWTNSSHKLGLVPVFDEITDRNIKATEGQTLLLPCSVTNLGDKVVSWIRSRDLHILTSGRFSFSSDNRFEPVASLDNDFWGLRIRGVKITDNGQYECQVNTDPKMSLAINLTGLLMFAENTQVSGVSFVADQNTNSKWIGKALIKGPSKVYVKDGSPVAFTCEISPLSLASLQSPSIMTNKPRVRWLHDNKELFFENNNTRITMDTHFNAIESKVTSILRIASVTWTDSGQYSCLQMSVQPDHIWLIIIEGEHTEAMQRDYPTSSKGHQKTLQCIPLLIIFTCLFIMYRIL